MKIPQYFDSIMFTADLYVDGKRAGTASDDGNGGECNYEAQSTEGQKLILQAEEFCRKQGEIQLSQPGVDQLKVDRSLREIISTLANEHYNTKALEKDTKRGIVFGKNGHYQLLKFEKPISLILNEPGGDKVIEHAFRKEVLPKLEKGYELVNTNLPQSIMAIIAELFPEKAIKKPIRLIKLDTSGRKKKL